MLQKTLRDLTFYYTNENEFRKLYEEIFKTHMYYVELDTLSPRILDCGGHIGLATMYFKTMFPDAKITVFEPIPRIIKLLHKNLEANKIMNVEVVPKALSSKKEELKLNIDTDVDTPWLSTSSVIAGAWNKSQFTREVKVETTLLSEYLDEPIDLLKMDIEGAETEVLAECQNKLVNIKHILIEFHANREHRPEKLIQILKNSRFQLKVTQEGKEIEVEKMTRRKPTLYLIEGSR